MNTNVKLMEARDVNEFRGARQYMHRWDYFKDIEAPSALGTMKILTQKSTVGNLNVNGTSYSSTSQMFFAAQSGFLSAVEPGIRPIVQWVACEMNLITYTSCEGHYYQNDTAPDMRHFGILTRNQQEHDKVRALFISVASLWNDDYGTQVAEIALMDHDLQDTNAKLSALDLFILKNESASWDEYFDTLDAMSDKLLTILSAQSRQQYDAKLPEQLQSTSISNIEPSAHQATDKKSRYDTIYVVLKVTEVCNLDCTYCFFFNSGDTSYEHDPAYISEQNIVDMAKTLAQGAKDLDIRTVEISFHGGEPLMLGFKRFEKMCQILNHHISPVAQLKFSVQTNGLLLSQKWIALLSAYDVSIGLSLDGPEEVNDEFRIKSNGQGSYKQTIDGLNELKQAQQEGIILGFGVNCVINPNSDSITLFKHFVDELNINGINFAPPIMDWTDHNLLTEQKITQFYHQLTKHWIETNNPNIRIELLSRTLGALLGDANADSLGRALANIHPTITIRSNGDMCPDDALNHKSTKFRHTGYNVSKDTLKSFFEDPIWNVVDEKKLADGCKQCQWLGICGGGPMEQRWSKNNDFINISTYCNTRKTIFQEIYDYVCKFVEQSDIDKRLESSSQFLLQVTPR